MKEAGNKLRYILYTNNPTSFPLDIERTDIYDLYKEILMQPHSMMTQAVVCTTYNLESINKDADNILLWHYRKKNWTNSAYINVLQKYATLQSWLPIILKEPLRKKCGHCQLRLEHHTTYNIFPSFMAFYIGDVSIRFEEGHLI